MSYFFTNPQVKKWKTLFYLSLFLNVVLGVLLFVEMKKDVHRGTVVKEAVSKESVKKIPEREAPSKKKEDPVIRKGELQRVFITVEDNFFSSFANSEDVKRFSNLYSIPNLDELLSAHVSRNLVWQMTLRKDVRNGDQLSFLFRVIPEAEKRQRNDLPDDVEVLALNYFSKKYDKEIKIFRYKPEGVNYPKFFYSDGRRIEASLRNSPMKEDDYIQVTSLLHDRSPKHEGIDFKAPIGTVVHSPVEGRVLRRNWKTRYNGYCIEIKAKGSPHTIKFLHLSEVLVKPNQVVSIGEPIAKSGNTGKTTAPHLHYQINVGRNGKIVDPLKHHDIYHQSLQGEELKKFRERMATLSKTLQK